LKNLAKVLEEMPRWADVCAKRDAIKARQKAEGK